MAQKGNLMTIHTTRASTRITNCFFLVLFTFSLAGCVHVLMVDTTPEGAEVYLDGEYKGETPLRANYDIVFDWRDTPRVVEIKMDGYKTKVIRTTDKNMDRNPFKFDLKSLNTITNHPSQRPSPETTYSKSPKDPTQNFVNKSWAVIIGISQYQHAGKKGLTNLIFADDDAKTFARTLLKLGWSKSHIKLITNEKATQRNIMIKLESWLTKAGPNDQIILFWAGHGFPDPEDPEKVYFACYDTDISIPATGYRMDKVRTALEERRTKNVIVLADTCHAGKLITRGERGISIVPNIKKKNIPKGWVFMVGADTDRQAVEHSSWSNGAFTHSLIKGLSGKADGFQSAGAKDGVVSMGELKAYMNTAMPDETQKVLGVAKRPVITTSTGDPDIWNLTLHVK